MFTEANIHESLSLQAMDVLCLLRYARPVQQLVPVAFIDWMEAQNLTAREMVNMLEACQAIGYKAVMQRERVPVEAPMDLVDVALPDLGQYDRLYVRGAVQ